MSEEDHSLAALRLKEPPLLLNDGKRNPDHLRWQVRVINRLSVDVALGKEEMPRGYNLGQAKDLIETEAKLCGLDPKHLMDVRTDAQVYADATEALLDSPDELFSKPDRMLDEMERQMNAADGFLIEECGAGNQRVRDARLDKKDVEARNASKKAWGERIKRLKRIRDRARNPFPEGSAPPNRPAMSAAHVLRFMVYVGRNEDGGVPLVGKHHGDMSLALYEAEFRRRWQNLEWVPVLFTGFLGIMPPGHGKSFLMTHWCGLRIGRNPRLRGLTGHAQAGMAEQNLAAVTSILDPKTAQGRRCRSLFPNIPAIRKQTTDTLDLEDIGDEKKKAPTLMAYGITAKISGSDADFIWFDDPCDQEIAEQETTRKRVFDRMNGTWRRRLREKPSGDGHWPFELTTTTLWHHDDPNARRVQLARDKKIKLRVKILSCGGPDKAFKPVWPEMYSAAKLKVVYAEMRNPSLYAACYESNPQPESLRKIRRLAYYLPGGEEHAAFRQTAIFHITIDPTATNRDKSDMAAYIYAGCGDIVAPGVSGTMEYTRKLRIMDGKEIHARQGETVTEVCDYAEHNSTHYVHSELVGGFEAIREFFEARGLDVIGHQPHGKSKEVRLGHVSTMLDDSLRDRGFPGAVVEFPGKIMPDGKIGPDPESPLAWLEDQLLNFGVARGDHGVDALVYLAKHLGPELNVAEGAVTRTLQAKRRAGIEPRMERELAGYLEAARPRTAAQDDHDFFMEGQE